MSNIPLSNSREVVERSIFHSIRKELIDKGYLSDMDALIEGNITAIDQTNKVFTIAGDKTYYFILNRNFNILNDPTGNNGVYTIASSSYIGGNTEITVNESIPSSIIAGKVSIYQYYDDTQGIADYQATIPAIITAKGFVIEIFGVGAQRAKYQKKIPRIVIIANQTLPGGLGGSPDKIFSPNNGDPLNPDAFTAEVMPPQTVDMTYDIHLVSSTSEQARIMHGIIGLGMPKRGYIKQYDNPTGIPIFVNQYSYRNVPDPSDNIMEDIYMFQANDIFETSNETVGTNIAPITEITLETNEGTPDNNTPFNTEIIT